MQKVAEGIEAVRALFPRRWFHALSRHRLQGRYIQIWLLPKTMGPEN